jgi:hypothetical protein
LRRFDHQHDVFSRIEAIKRAQRPRELIAEDEAQACHH